MQLLIVHEDIELGEQLRSMLDEYTAHSCHLVDSGEAALRWARERAHCRLLLTQLDGAAIEGLALGGFLSEAFPGLQTMFLPSYPATDQRVALERTKIFPEPIDGESLLEAVEIAARVGSGAPDLFQVLDVLQMCCLSRKTGAVQVVNETRSGIVYLREGRIVHAESPAAQGTEALLEIAGWGEVEFAYDASVLASETIALPWNEILSQEINGHQIETRRASKQLSWTS